MTSKEQNRLKILLLILFGIVLAVFAFTVLNSPTKVTDQPSTGMSQDDAAKQMEEFEQSFQEHVAKQPVQTEEEVQSQIEELQKAFEEKASTPSEMDSQAQMEEFQKIFNEHVSQ